MGMGRAKVRIKRTVGWGGARVRVKGQWMGRVRYCLCTPSPRGGGFDTVYAPPSPKGGRLILSMHPPLQGGGGFDTVYAPPCQGGGLDTVYAPPLQMGRV